MEYEGLEDIITLIKNELEVLPGENSHNKMVPESRRFELEKLNISKEPKKSSVLCLIYPKNKEHYIALMKRPDYEGVHGGQISFPGGKMEDFDRNEFETALREANEELGINPEGVIIIGKLSSVFIPPSNFNVEVIVGYSKHKPDFIIDKREVDQVVEMKVSSLLNEDILKSVKLNHPKYGGIEVPAFVYERHVIWGATAMMLSELRDILTKIIS